MHKLPLTKENIKGLKIAIEEYDLPLYQEVLNRLADRIEDATPEELVFLDTLFQEIILEIGAETFK